MAAGSSMGERGAGVDAGTVGRGAAIGALAFVVGYLIAGLLAPDRGSSAVVEATSLPAWKGVGWYFYSAHFVDLAVSAEAGQFSEAGTRNLVRGADDMTVTLLYLAPPLLLGFGGAVLARTLGGAAGPGDGAKAGMLVIAGYFPLGLIGALLTEHTETVSLLITRVSATWSVELLPAVIVAGVLYPLVFGALGGAVASALEN